MYKVLKNEYHLNMRINKKLLICTFLPVILGTIVGLITGNKTDYIKPTFSPPGFVFPIVWSILYIIMGYSSYIIAKSDGITRFCALKIYYSQLTINLLWSFIFFSFNQYLVSFIVIILLLINVAIMIYKFYRISIKASLLNLPYLLWLIFASILCFSVYYLN